MMRDEHTTANAPMVRDIRAYEQDSAECVRDELRLARDRKTAFLTDDEEQWYQTQIAKYRRMFRLKPQDD